MNFKNSKIFRLRLWMIEWMLKQIHCPMESKMLKKFFLFHQVLYRIFWQVILLNYFYRLSIGFLWCCTHIFLNFPHPKIAKYSS